METQNLKNDRENIRIIPINCLLIFKILLKIKLQAKYQNEKKKQQKNTKQIYEINNNNM